MPALYRKYRSVSFTEVIGQSQVTDVLEASLKQNRIAHGYLFVGPHGVGKTSVARILAFAIVGEKYATEKKHIDVIEIDAASNTGVDNIRELIDKAQITPSLADKKVYIIDEVHMLSKSAFNALLKTLEEPPQHVVFILATTEEYKVLSTIASRMQKFVFRKVSQDLITEHLTKIAKDEKIKIDTAAIAAVAAVADGSVRDAISLLDQLSSLTKTKKTISETTVRQILGLASYDTLDKILTAYGGSDATQVAAGLEQLRRQNITAGEIATQLAKRAQDRLTEHPELINLMARLIDVPKSPIPELALTVATFPPNVVTSGASKPAKTKPATASTKPKPKSEPEAVKKAESTAANASQFEWSSLVAVINQNAKPIAGHFKGANYKLSGNKLTIILRNAFQKKTLDNPSRIKEIQSALADMNCSGLEIETVVDKTIAKNNDKISNIVQIMGGGEEVAIDGKI